MKIAFAMINCNRRDGHAHAVNEVAERLARKHEVHLFARKVEDLDTSCICCHYVPGLSRPEAANFATYHFLANRWIDPSRYDIVHSVGCNTLRANVIALQSLQPAKWRILAAVKRGEKVSSIRRLTRWLHYKITAAAEKRLYEARPGRKAPLFLPVSRGMERELRAHYQIGAAPVRVIPNGADTQKFRRLGEAEREQWRRGNGIAPHETMLIFAGGEWVRKGLEEAIRALALLPERRVKLFVAGDDPDRARFVSLAAELGLRDRVVFGGFRRDVAAALGSADAFLFPSWYEAFSLATIEAAACEAPVFATRISGAEDFIEPGVNGVFIEHVPEQIAAVLREALPNVVRLRSMGESGRDLVERRYTWDRVAEATGEAYAEYLGLPAARPVN